jgi:hypothetical protein
LKDLKTNPPPEDEAEGSAESADRRRLGKVVHDDRGMASVEWLDAPENYVRPVLELEDGATATSRLKALRDKTPVSVAKQDPYNPYHRSGAAPDSPTQGIQGTQGTQGGTRRDLRKLSAWIKMMREVEERKELDKEEAEKPKEE